MRPFVHFDLPDAVWTVMFKDSETGRLTWHDCDSWAHALRVANRIARRQARESA